MHFCLRVFALRMTPNLSRPKVIREINVDSRKLTDITDENEPPTMEKNTTLYQRFIVEIDNRRSNYAN